MSQDTNVSNLIINKLTKSQYEGITNPSPTELYFVTDEGESISTLGDVTLTSLANGQILQYNAVSGKWENVTQGGQSQAITTLATSGTITLADNSINRISPTAAVTFTLPTITDNTVFHQILIQVYLSTVYSMDLGTTYFMGGVAPNMSNAGYYNIIYEYDSTKQDWCAGVVFKAEVV